MDSGPYDNFLRVLMQPEYLIFLAILSVAAGITAWAHGVAMPLIIAVTIMPYALYGMCAGIVFAAFYIFFFIWSKF